MVAVEEVDQTTKEETTAIAGMTKAKREIQTTMNLCQLITLSIQMIILDVSGRKLNIVILSIIIN